MLSAGQAKIYNFGVFLGNRYGPSGNVMFIDGNDYWGGPNGSVVLGEMGGIRSAAPPASVGRAEMDGIRSVAPRALESVEIYPTISTTYDDPNAAQRSDWGGCL